MQPWKRIFCPVDFSEHSRLALEQAAYLATSVGCELTLMHVYEWEMVEPLPTDRVAAIEAGITEQLQALAREVGLPNSKVDIEVLRGVPATEILRCAKDGGFDAVVMGTHGRSGLTHLLLGSTAERVVRHAPCPVLIVRR